jgi:hypothetical protein
MYVILAKRPCAFKLVEIYTPIAYTEHYYEALIHACYCAWKDYGNQAIQSEDELYDFLKQCQTKENSIKDLEDFLEQTSAPYTIKCIDVTQI